MYLNRNFLCWLGIHRWHKSRFSFGAMVQCYARKQCEICGIFTEGYSRRNHPDFREILGEYD